MSNGGFIDAQTLEGELTADVCVIGSGAGGAVTAQVLAAAGLEVIVVEEGGHRTRPDFKMREDVAFQQLYEDGGARATKDAAIAILQGRSVGGSTVVNWTTCFRTPETVLDHWKANHGSTISLAELMPHYLAVEERLSIAAWPLEESNANNRLLYEGCKAIGVEVAPTRRNVKRCMKSGYCGMGCPVDAKQSMIVTYLPDAVAKGARVVYGLRVDRLDEEAGKIVRARGTAMGGANRYSPTGKLLTIRAKHFVLSAGAINSPGILLRSGIAGAVGRRTFIHPVVGVAGLFKDPVEPYYGPPQSIAAHGLAHRTDGIGLFLEAAPLHPMMASLASSGQGADHLATMRTLPHLTAHIALVIDGFSAEEPGGTVTLRGSGAPVLDYPIGPRVVEGFRTAMKTLARLDLAAGAQSVRTGHDPSITVRSEADLAKLDALSYEPGRIAIFSAHLMGGCALGSDPATSVVRPEDLRHHSVENLHVIDGSVFPTSLGVNPQLSIYGLAHRTATRLASAWKA